MTTCIECGHVCKLVTGKEIYPHRSDLWEKPIWRCTHCPKSYCGCHPGTTEPLGFAAGPETRRARMLLHERMLDPIWKSAPKKRRRYVRTLTYALLSEQMELPEDETHTGMWTVEQCREAWRILDSQTYETILAWREQQKRSTA
jgi:hypothetical protein